MRFVAKVIANFSVLCIYIISLALFDDSHGFHFLVFYHFFAYKAFVQKVLCKHCQICLVCPADQYLCISLSRGIVKFGNQLVPLAVSYELDSWPLGLKPTVATINEFQFLVSCFRENYRLF